MDQFSIEYINPIKANKKPLYKKKETNEMQREEFSTLVNRIPREYKYS